VVGIAFVGCGYCADFYAITLRNHKELNLLGVFDLDSHRAQNFARRYSTGVYGTFEELLFDKSVQVVVNLTPPSSHYEVSRACLVSGKHVYSEKPFATSMDEARELVSLARSRDLLLSSSPPTVLGAAARTVSSLLKSGAIGRPLVAYAELEGGAIYNMNHEKWMSISGVPWPSANEFEVGCTIEHSGYCLTWLSHFFGPAVHLVSSSFCLVPDKLDRERGPSLGDDFSVACIEYSSGVVARVTCGLVSPQEHRLMIVGTKGNIVVDDIWQTESPVSLQSQLPRSEYGTDALSQVHLGPRQRVELIGRDPDRVKYDDVHDIDYAAGIAEMCKSILNRSEPLLGSAFILHVLEQTLAIADGHNTYRLTTSF